MDDKRNDDFDRLARGLHARAVERVPAGTVYALRVRRTNASPMAAARPARARAGGWLLAGGLAAVAALAVAPYLPGTAPGPGDPGVPALARGTPSTAAPSGDPASGNPLAAGPLPGDLLSGGTQGGPTQAAEALAWEDGLAALDEDPDLYLWLGSQDTLILAME